MFPVPIEEAELKSMEYYTRPVVCSSGFREYDMRWRFPEQINLQGVQAVGLGIGTFIQNSGIKPPKVIVGHDYRSYSVQVKTALCLGLLASGCNVIDIGLSISPMAYFAQFDLDARAVAMVTASHNPDGWTGVKIGVNPPLTCTGEEINAIKKIVLSGGWLLKNNEGSYRFVHDEASRYLAHVTKNKAINRKLRIVCACGNGTPSLFVPKALAMIGVEVIPLNAVLDHNFPNYNPNPESQEMLDSMISAVNKHNADGAFGFDGDGDRCWVVDEEGRVIFPDKMGVILARNWAKKIPDARFAADVKSTSLFFSDPELVSYGAKTEYCRTGHSYMKICVKEKKLLAGFEHSGHMVLGPPLGLGYDDGVALALEVCCLLNENPDMNLSHFRDSLPPTWSTPTIALKCNDSIKYQVVSKISEYLEKNIENFDVFEGRKIRELIKVNGVRVVLDGGAWFLIRASSNADHLVLVCESPNSRNEMMSILKFVHLVLKNYPEVEDFSPSTKVSW